jgi:hypothetical protein
MKRYDVRVIRHTGLGTPAMRPTRLLVLVAAVAGVGLSPGQSHAHDLHAKVTFTATEVKVVAGYDDDTPADGAKVTLTTDEGHPVAAGVLDATGNWTTPLPPPGKYHLVVNDIGHRDRVEFTIDPPQGDAARAEITYERWRLDKTLGLGLGLGALLGGTVLYTFLRRRRG